MSDQDMTPSAWAWDTVNQNYIKGRLMTPIEFLFVAASMYSVVELQEARGSDHLETLYAKEQVGKHRRDRGPVRVSNAEGPSVWSMCGKGHSGCRHCMAQLSVTRLRR